jgi:hypothetical protein
MKTDPFTYGLYHLPYQTDLEAHQAYDALYPRVRAVAGILWVAHNHGVSSPSFLVVALPTRTNPETREELLGEAEAVATLSDAELVERIDVDLAALLPKEEEGDGE